MISLSPAQIDKDCKRLARHISSYDFTHIMYIERGGKYVYDILKKYINKKHKTVPIKVSFYDKNDNRKLKPIVKYPSNYKFTRKDKVLIVDDLIDSGKSLIYLLNMSIFNNVKCLKTAVLYTKPHSPINPSFSVKELNDWIIFYWEK